MKTIETRPENKASPQAQQPPVNTQNIQLAIVHLGDFIFHNKWFHSARISPSEDGMAQLNIELINPGGIGPGMVMRGTVEEVTQAYTSLLRQVGTINPQSLMGAKPAVPEGEPNGNRTNREVRGGSSDSSKGESGEGG